LKTTSSQIQDTVNEQVVQLLIEEGILETVFEIGMQFQVGSKGDRLSGGQRQKLAIARAFLKEPPILIMDEATSALDNKSQTRIQTLLDTHWRGKATLIAVVHRLDIIKNFDKIGVMKSGKIEEMGSYEELMATKGLLYELVAGKS
jgi:ABC-type multidrug transport system fused ATPase/permease subunit